MSFPKSKLRVQSVPNSLTDLCQGRPDRAVEAVVNLWQALWTSAKREQSPAFEGPVCILPVDGVLENLQAELKSRFWLADDARAREQLADQLLGLLQTQSGRSAFRLPRDHFCAFEFVQEVLPAAAQKSDLQYWTSRDLRSSAQMALSAPVMHAVQRYTKRIRAWLESLAEPVGHYGMFLVEQNAGLSAANFFNLAAAMGWIWPAQMAGQVAADPSLFEAEKLVGRYFGLPTSIPGMNAIFAGSGPLIIDSPKIVSTSGPVELSQPIGGRVIVITGPYGSGKSTLALEMAIEVARKGGAVIVAAMEQSPEECLYSLESLGISTRSKYFETVREMREAMPLFTQPYSGTGVLAFLPILRPGVAEQEDQFTKFLELLAERFRWVQSYPLKLVIVDPMNSVLAQGQEQESGRRRRLLETFQDAKRLGINLCLTRERTGDLDKDAPFEENIADTVMHVLTVSRGGILRRSVEIRKSRLQREEPGRHDLLMVQDKGLQIFPSSAAVARTAANAKPRRKTSKPTYTGIDGIDRLLGRGGLCEGDIIALDGPPGSSRTLIGEHFLFVKDLNPEPIDHRDNKERAKSLFISDSDRETILSQLEFVHAQRWDRERYGKKSLEDILVCPMLVESVQPSQILQAIQDQFEQAKREKRRIDRVLLADVSRWEAKNDPSQREDAFGYALMGLLRSYGATCVLLADYVSDDRTSILRDVIVHGADCILKFERMEFRGQLRQFVRATKSREMTHQRDLFEMMVASGAVDVRSNGVLLRKDETGNVHPVKIRLFLHADSAHHYEFNTKLVGSIKTSLTDAVIDDQWSHYDPQMFRLSASSAVDEVQVMQLDEFQLPNGDDAEVHRKFFIYRPSETSGLPDSIGQFVERLGKRIVVGDPPGYIAAPFYQNISVLARHRERLEAALGRTDKTIQEFDRLSGAETWLELQRLAQDWESQGEEYLFFSCPLSHQETVETYNCVFFEILLTFVQPRNSKCRLADWLARPQARVAAMIFRDLCYRSHRHEREYFEKRANPMSGHTLRSFTPEFDSNRCGPVFWRHWYNTLSEMMWDLPPPGAIEDLSHASAR